MVGGGWRLVIGKTNHHPPSTIHQAKETSMSAAIKVEQGPESGLNYQIEEDVFRIGSNDRCSLRLNDSTWFTTSPASR
jgi:hypothetical protein